MNIGEKEILRQLRAVLREAFDGAPTDDTYFSGRGREASLLGTLEATDAATASRAVGGSSVAAHADHIAFWIPVQLAGMRGERLDFPWTESWRVSEVDDTAWAQIQTALKQGYADLTKALETGALAHELAFGTALSAVTHVAYHLGAIRQKLVILRNA